MRSIVKIRIAFESGIADLAAWDKIIGAECKKGVGTLNIEMIQISGGFTVTFCVFTVIIGAAGLVFKQRNILPVAIGTYRGVDI